MTNHQKRLSAPRRWPVERKSETFTVKSDAGPHGEAGVPLLVLLRDVLGYVDSRKEARYALNQDSVVINGTTTSDEERPVGMFDILAFDEREEYYRVFPGEGGRLALTPIDAEAAGSKLGKIVDKRTVSGGEIQLTLHDGQTLLVDDHAYTPGDSLVVANGDSEASAGGPEAGEIVAHFEYETGALVTAVAGSHAGEIGAIEEIQVTPGSAENNVLVTQEDVAGNGDAGGFETIEEYVVVIDENFIEDDDSADTDADADSAGDDGADADAGDIGAGDDSADTDAGDDSAGDDGQDKEVDADGGDQE